MYLVGDNIFYPMHGAGRIDAIEEKEVSGEKRQYYIIHMIDDNMKVMIPKEKVSKSNIRPVTDIDTVKEIIMMIETEESDKDLPWKQRLKANEDRIKSGSLKACVEVVHALMHMQKEEKLNSSEKRLLKQAQKFLMSELKLVEGMDKDKKDQFISRLTEDRKAIS
ncbi:CarD family transcriptional regulator [Salinicoccus kekensis]|uniref:CarD family transcriptional regulator n=1 Tax=Salinicoccus kekensis TaxID=714307 RepID=A0A285U928_9STAP|nr:CarD family transcriptional regulator [Salinicoccus kekensis]SOC38243.1 CarD family transcriptional regulator [Salinicoccus kekensis]